MLGLAAVVEDVSQALKVDPPIYRRRMDFFSSDSEFDTSRARQVLGWEPRVDLREGVRAHPTRTTAGAACDVAWRDRSRARTIVESTGDGDLTEPWQLQLYRRSLKKKLTVGALLEHLPSPQGKLCLEVGCGTGLTSYFLRQRGGTWVSSDFERDHVRSAKQLVGDRVLQTSDAELPFRSSSFDLVAAINFLEHIEDDETGSSGRWCGCSSRVATSSSWPPRARPAGRATRSSGCSASPPTRRASDTPGTAIRPRLPAR